MGLSEAKSHQQYQLAHGLGGDMSGTLERSEVPRLRMAEELQGEARQPGASLPPAHQTRRSTSSAKCCRWQLSCTVPGSRECGSGASEVLAPALFEATGLAQPRQPTSAPPQERQEPCVALGHTEGSSASLR